MPLPTSVPETAGDAFNRVLATAASVKSNLSGVGSLIANGGPVYMDNLIGLYQNLSGAQSTGIALQGTSGLTDYAKTKVSADFDINNAFASSIVACKAVTDWLLENMPGDGKGGYIGWQHQTDGSITRVTVDPATLAPLSSLIASALATFE